MIALLLINKIISLFLMMGLGIIVVKAHILKYEDSRILSVLCLYAITPCVIISSFLVEYSPEVRDGLLLAVFAAVASHVILIASATLIGKILHMNVVERASVIYSNAGNLVIPLVSAILGPEYVIYTSAYMSVELFLMWSHASSMLSGETSIDLKKVFTNINFISVIVGVFLFIFQIRLPGPVEDAFSSLGTMIGPISMIMTGMLIGHMHLKDIFLRKRAYLAAAFRLIIMPLLIITLIKLAGLPGRVADGEMIMLCTVIATITPPASTITQMALLYDRDAEYATAINLLSTFLCIVTMPLMVAYYQL